MHPRRIGRTELIERRPQRFQDTFTPVEGANGGEHVRGIRALRAPRLDELAAAAPREQGVEEPRLRRPSDQAATKFTEDRGVAPGVCALQAPQIFPIDAAAHSFGRLVIGEPFRALQERHERQPPGREGGLSVRGEQPHKCLIREQRIQLIGHAQVPVPLGKRRVGDTGRFGWYGLDRHRAKHGTPPNESARPSLPPMHRTSAWRTSPSVSKLTMSQEVVTLLGW
jgi:hypothetical protein